jgi:prepilin peptidase CpaA
MASIIVALLTLVMLAVTLLSCVSDFRTMRIPNLYSAIVLIGFVAAWLISPGSFGKWWDPLIAFAIMFAVTFGMYCAGMVGSGDTKLGSALAPWVGLKGMALYLFFMALVGGALGIMAIIMRKKNLFAEAPVGSWIAQVQSGKSAVPYGIAITAGAWAALFHTGFFHHQIDELIKIIH